MMMKTKETTYSCTDLLRMAANKISDMSGISKLFKLTSKTTLPAQKTSTVVAATATSSISPDCAWVMRQKYLRGRRLVTRTDVRARMSIWTRLFNWCRSGRRSQHESESIFTIRP